MQADRAGAELDPAHGIEIQKVSDAIVRHAERDRRLATGADEAGRRFPQQSFRGAQRSEPGIP